jgi:hypothetical protein
MRGHAAISAGEFVEKQDLRAHNMNVPAARCYERDTRKPCMSRNDMSGGHREGRMRRTTITTD